MNGQKSSDRSGRTRNWTWIVYPESAPENWRDLIDETHTPYLVSPLHDRDINATGEPKKPHWHVFAAFEGVKSYEQVIQIAELCKGSIPQRVESARGMARYLAHLDNPEKAQYDPQQIEEHGGLSAASLTGTEQDRELDLIGEIIDYIEDNDITEYRDIVSYARYNNREWFRALAYKCSYIIGQYIKSKRSKAEAQRAAADRVQSGERMADRAAKAAEFAERHPEQ